MEQDGAKSAKTDIQGCVLLVHAHIEGILVKNVLAFGKDSIIVIQAFKFRPLTLFSAINQQALISMLISLMS